MERTNCFFAMTASLLLQVAFTTTAAAAAASPPLPHANVWEPTFPAAPLHHVTIPLAGAVSAPSLFELHGRVTIGSPPQDFRMVFETDGDAVWVPNFHAPPTSHHAVYDHSKSHSYEPDGAGAIGTGMDYTYIGYQSRDTLRFGDTTLVNATFVEATQVPSPPNWGDLAIDGMVGLSPRLGQNTVLAQLTRAGLLAESVFAFYLPRARSVQSQTGTSSVGELSIGAVDTRRFVGNVQYVDTVSFPGIPAKWVIALDAVTVSGGGDNSSNQNFASPTRTTTSASSVAAVQAHLTASLPLIIGPKEDIARLEKAVGADGATIDCDAAGPDITIHIGGTAYVLTKDDYTLRDGGGAGSNETCRWAFVGMKLPGLWLLGQPFMQAVYTVFDFGATPPRVGFAQAPAA